MNTVTKLLDALPKFLPHRFGLPIEKRAATPVPTQTPGRPPGTGGAPPPSGGGPPPVPPSQGGPPVQTTPPVTPPVGPPGQRPPPPPVNTPAPGTFINSPDPTAAQIFQIVMSSGYGTYSNRPQATGSLWDPAEVDVFYHGYAGNNEILQIARARGEVKATITYGQATDKRFFAMEPSNYQGGVLRGLFTPSDWVTSQGRPQRIDVECTIYATDPATGKEAPPSTAYATLLIDPNNAGGRPTDPAILNPPQ